MHHLRTGLTSVVVLALALLPLTVALTGCGQQSVDELRQNYSAELNGWVEKETPISAEATITVGEGDDGGEQPAGEGEVAGEDGEQPAGTGETVQVSKSVMLDIVVKHRGAGKLDGLTLDIYQGNPELEEPKRNWKVFVDTSDMAVAKQVTRTIEGVDLEPGDGFSVEVREHVPPEERGEYKEFQQQGS